jgi:Tol biopolymer transport system component
MEAVSAAEKGPLVYVAGSEAPDIDLVWIDRDGKRLSKLDSVRPPPFSQYPPQISPDGKMVADASREQRNMDICLYDTKLYGTGHGNRTRFTLDPANDVSPIWSPDGRSIAFASNRSGRSAIYRKAADQSGSEQLLYGDSEQNYPTSWSAMESICCLITSAPLITSARGTRTPAFGFCH